MNELQTTAVSLKMPKILKKQVSRISFERKENELPYSTINDVIIELITVGLAHSKPEIPTA